MPTMEVDFEVYCEQCGDGICNHVADRNPRHPYRVVIAPCRLCLKDARDEGYSEGRNEGYAKGRDDALREQED